MDTLSTKERLVQLEHEIGRLAPSSSAEKAFARANSAIENPWKGSGAKLEALELQRDDLILAERGQKLHDLVNQKRELERRLERSQIARQAADRQLLERSQHETVVRYREAVIRCMNLGIGASFELFRNWFESGRPLYSAAPECASYFINGAEAKAAGVSFDIQKDREAVNLWLEAREASNTALMAFNNDASELRDLLREHPELGSA
jgi:hypothetical protein